jgi:hypothetical protein
MNITNWIYNYDNIEERPGLQNEFKDFGSLSKSHLLEIFSGNYVKYEGAGYLLLNTNIEYLKSRTAELLTWIQDMNWPSATYIFQLLLKFGDDIIYDIKNALKNSPNDSIWQDNIIRLLLKLDSNKIKELEVELIKIVSNAD